MGQIVLLPKVIYPENRTQLYGKIKVGYDINSTAAKPLRNLDHSESGHFFLDFLLHYQIYLYMDFFKTYLRC